MKVHHDSSPSLFPTSAWPQNSLEFQSWCGRASSWTNVSPCSSLDCANPKRYYSFPCKSARLWCTRSQQFHNHLFRSYRALEIFLLQRCWERNSHRLVEHSRVSLAWCRNQHTFAGQVELKRCQNVSIHFQLLVESKKVSKLWFMTI